MRCPGRILNLALLLAVGLAPALRADGRSDELEQNRLLLERVRGDPQQEARLRQNLEAFLALSPERQELLRRLDRDLHEQDPATQKRLTGALERYTRWYDRLSEQDRRAIDAAPNAPERLGVIKSIRERQWLERLPRAEREKVDQAPGPERQALIRDLRQKQKKHRQDWQTALRHWGELNKSPPTHLADFPYGVQVYVNDYLRPLLASWEEQRLKNWEDRPGLSRVIVALADRHAVVLPGPAQGPASFQDLPADVRKPLEKLDPGTRARLQEAEGTWPDFAVWVAAAARAKGIRLPRELGPSRPREFSLPVQQFLNKRLLSDLTAAEQTQLQAAEGHWPLYPRLVLQLAAKHGLQVPGGGARLHLPGPAAYWERFRGKSAGR